jgi:prepilin-type N-terminal cleavage/methylation domain-containing protein
VNNREETASVRKIFEKGGIRVALKTITLRHTRSRHSNKLKKEANSMLNKLNKRRGGFTLVEIMIVVAIIALLAAIAVPGFLRSRKRSQAAKVINDLRLIDSAVDQYAIETTKQSGSSVAVTDWTNYLKKDTQLFATGADLFGHDYGAQTVDSHPIVPPTTYATLSDVADTSYWSPFNP